VLIFNVASEEFLDNLINEDRATINRRLITGELISESKHIEHQIMVDLTELLL
jgi:hypothetical protein